VSSPEIEKRFTYHPPKDGQPELYQAIRDMAKMMATIIENTCPESREKAILTRQR
jgi:hypothetical protein